MIWATVSSWSCFCQLYRASPSLAAKNIISLISVLTIWWCPCVESSLVLLEEGVCYDHSSPLPHNAATAPAPCSRRSSTCHLAGESLTLDVRSSIRSAKTRPGADCGSDHELLINKFRFKLKKVGRTTRPFRYDLNQIPYDYTVEVINRFTD